MKKYVLLLIFCELWNESICQITYSLSPVKTPKCSDVTAYEASSEASPEWLALYEADATSQYPNATVVSSASVTYNCHGYAWHKSNGGSARWIGLNNTTHEDIYMTDGSYVELSGPAPSPIATKVSYPNDDHSAITTTTSNVFMSKWGSWPLMQHAATYSPYTHSNLKYYSVPITGPDLVCASPSSTFQTFTPSSGTTTYSWSTGSFLSPSSQSGTTNSFSVSGTGNGYSYVNVQLSNSCSGTTVTGRKSIWVGHPMPSTITSPNMSMDGTTVCASQYLDFILTNDYPDLNSLDYDWQVTGGTLITNGGISATVYTPGASQGIYFHVMPTNSCGTGHWYQTFVAASEVDGNYCFESLMFSMYPNPVESSFTIEVNDSYTSSDGEFEVVILDSFGSSTHRRKIIDKVTNFDCKGLTPGLHYVTIYDKKGNKVDQKRISIK